MAPVLFGVGGFGTLGSIADLDYFEWLNDLEDWVKSRKYSTKGGKHEVEEKIEKVKTAVLNSPQLSRGKKANITRIQNNIKRAIEEKDWRSVKYNLEDLKQTMKGYNLVDAE